MANCQKFHKVYRSFPKDVSTTSFWFWGSFKNFTICIQSGNFECHLLIFLQICLFVCVEVLRPSQPNMVMSSAVSLPNHTFTGQA